MTETIYQVKKKQKKSIITQKKTDSIDKVVYKKYRQGTISM